MSVFKWSRNDGLRERSGPSPFEYFKDDGSFDWDRLEHMSLGGIGPALRDLHERMKRLEAKSPPPSDKGESEP